jgi:outer membrane protein assembly factor BamB
MKLSDLIFTGFNKRVAALDRASGEIVWHWKAHHNGYVTLLLDGDMLLVSVNGFMYALDALTGRLIWENEMAGFGYGVTSLVSKNGVTGASLPAQAAAATAAAQAAQAGNGSQTH